jgi:hypothetical protein
MIALTVVPSVLIMLGAACCHSHRPASVQFRPRVPLNLPLNVNLNLNLCAPVPAGMSLLPESPRWLMQRGRHADAHAASLRLFGEAAAEAHSPSLSLDCEGRAAGGESDQEPLFRGVGGVCVCCALTRCVEQQ